ncbi:MAG: RNA ligase RtcB family protein [Gammaproteobacteria bacterium]|nr:RNA ligase RtcB family protein [Gammaproteobacteria bacterium]
MGNISENNFHNSSDRIHIVSNSDTWIEGKAIQQLEKTAELEGIVKAAGMPDLHPGRGYPIGAAFLSKNIIYPALVGNDIGCGMSLWNSNIKTRKVNLDKFERKLKSLETPLEDYWSDRVDSKLNVHAYDSFPFSQALGTIGGGNHFAELQQLDTVFSADELEPLGIDKHHLVLLVHSGSRGLGEQVLRQHVNQFGHKGLKVESQAFIEYMEQHQLALHFAELNRELIARRMLKYLSADGESLIDVNHNLVSRWQNDVEENDSFWIHRKGATPADQGLVMIPGSRGDYSYLVKPDKQDLESNKALSSLAHGAGRKWIRSECRARLSNRYTKHDLKRTSFGSRVVCENKDLIYEEAPEAYKSIDSVIDAMVSEDLIKPIARFKPVLTYKTGGQC